MTEKVKKQILAIRETGLTNMFEMNTQVITGFDKSTGAAITEMQSLEQVSANAYKNMGVSQSDYLASLNKMGALFQGSGLDQQRALDLSTQAMQRAADMASVMGISTEDALNAVTAAAKGNYTMMDNIGVSMNATTLEAYALSKGIDTAWASMSNADKAELAMSYFFEKTEQYSGNFARESTETLQGSISAVDLHNLNAETESFSFLDRVIVSCGDLCPEAEFILTEMKIPLNNPGGMEITLGDSRPSLVGDSVSGLSSAINRIKSIEADYTTNGEAVSIVQQEITNNTTILQSAEQILLTALEDYVRTSDYSAFQESVQTSLSIMSGTIEANFTETSSEITDLDGNVSQEFATIRSFIRMIATGIVIGESSSQIKLKLENDILYFFTGDEDSVSTQNALAYFSAGKLYVNDVQILTSMRIGPFAWVPEANNLNFKLMEST